MVLGTEGVLPAKHELLGRTGSYVSHGLLFLFLRYGTQTRQRGEGRTMCVYGYFKGHWDLNEDIKLLLLTLYTFE